MKDLMDTRENHPSFGVVTISRCSAGGGGEKLFGSDFRHQYFMLLTIYGAEHCRSLSRDWVFSKDTIIQIALSETQFVEMVSRVGMGDGTPCTLRYTKEFKTIPPPPDRPMDKPFRDDFSRHIKEATQGIEDSITDLEAAIESGKAGKTALRELVKKLRHAQGRISSEVPWVAEQFNKHMESTISKGKSEIEAHIAATTMRIGIESMRLEAQKNTLPMITEGGDAEPPK